MFRLLAAFVTTACLVQTVWAAPILTESFDYGDQTGLIRDGLAGNWDSSSGVVKYDHDDGLTHPAIFAEAGGSAWHDHPSGNRSLSNDTDFDLDPLPTASAGDTFWMAGLIELANLDGTTSFTWSNTEGVNTLGFGIDGSGNVLLIASDDDGGAAGHDSGRDAATGQTHLFLIRATIGAGDDSDKESTVDFWFNPADASTVAGLGTPDFTTGPDSKFGRSTGAYSNASINFSFQSRVDEIRVGAELADVTLIPEPASLALLGAAGLFLLARRH